MLLENLIVLQFAAFAFLALGIIPFRSGEKTSESGTTDYKLPLANKVLFVLVSGIIFSMLALTSNQYDYNYCYINETTANYVMNTSSSTATCASFVISNQGLSILNMGMAMISVVIMIIMVLFGALTFKDRFIED